MFRPYSIRYAGHIIIVRHRFPRDLALAHLHPGRTLLHWVSSYAVLRCRAKWFALVPVGVGTPLCARLVAIRLPVREELVELLWVML